MGEAIVVKQVTLLDVYNELVEVKDKQDDLCKKIGEYNGLNQRMDEFDLRIIHTENVLKKTEHLDEGKGLYTRKITTTIFFIIAIIGGLSGLIALSKSLIQMLQ